MLFINRAASAATTVHNIITTYTNINSKDGPIINPLSPNTAFIITLASRPSSLRQLIQITHKRMRSKLKCIDVLKINLCKTNQNLRTICFKRRQQSWVTRQRPRTLGTNRRPWHLNLKLSSSQNHGLHCRSCHPIWDVSASGLSCRSLANLLPPWH